MKKFLMATTAMVFAAGTAMAQTTSDQNDNQVPDTVQTNSTQTGQKSFGAAAGGTTGAIAGAAVGGPIGAIIGGFAGAVIGAETAVPEPAVNYVVQNPIDPVVVDAEISAGAMLPETVTVHPIPEHPEFAYVYTDSRPIIVKADTREIVYSPGYAVPEETIAWVKQNPADPISVDADITVGATLPGEIELRTIPNSSAYSYVWLDSGPALVDAKTRTVVWVQ